MTTGQEIEPDSDPPRHAISERDEWPARVEQIAEWLLVAACSLFVFLQLEPGLLLRDTTAAGGDMGAHVWFPAFLRDHLLGDLRLAGWSMDYFAGFPAGQFYFPLPALAVVGLDVILPYNVAFKLVTAIGPVLTPVGAAILLAGLRAPKPTPALAAVGATAFLFFKGSPHAADAQTIAFNQRIMGGTLASTLAGEFSFGIALALSLCFLGALAWSLRRRRALWVPALLGAAVVLSHLIVAVFAVIGAIVIWATHRPIRNAGPALAIGGVAGALTALWSLPLLASLSYTSDMRYEPITSYLTYLFPGYLAWMLPFVIVAVVVGIVEWRRSTLVLVVLTASMGVVFRFWEVVAFVPVWNLRMLPFWYLGLFLLTAVGAAELARGAGAVAGRAVRILREEPEDPDARNRGRPGADASKGRSARRWAALGERRRRPRTARSSRLPATGTAEGERRDVAHDAGHPVDQDHPGTRVRVITTTAVAVLVVAGTLIQVHDTRGFLEFWARWNYSGFEETGATGTGKAFPEYRALLDTMSELPPGRAVWEPSPDINRYGTTLALTHLPYETDGSIASLEGLYYESSGTTPYTFLTIAKLAGAGNASNPVRGLHYRTIADFELGVTQLQQLGVRYYLAHSEEARAAADDDPRLERVTTVPDLDVAPAGWEDEVRGGAPLVVSEPPVRISDVSSDERSLRFEVSEAGTPVVINARYTPHWHVDGADAPVPLEGAGGVQVMEVVPTEERVTMTYAEPPHGWEIFEVRGAELVSPLANEPVVVEDLRSRSSSDCYAARGASSTRTEQLGPWECIAAPWWDDPGALAVPLAAHGPPEWQRVRDVTDAEATPLRPVTVSDIALDRDEISFRVDEVGTPVVVKVSDFPNWRARGAEGPWRVSPNLMVVVPTDEAVTLEFATTSAEWIGRLVTLGGLVGLGFVIWWIPGRRPVRWRRSTGTMVRSDIRPQADA